LKASLLLGSSVGVACVLAQPVRSRLRRMIRDRIVNKCFRMVIPLLILLSVECVEL